MRHHPLDHCVFGINVALEARFQSKFQASELGRHVLHRLLCRAVTLRVIGRRIHRHCACRPLLDDFGLERYDRRLTVGLQADVLATPGLDVLDQLLHHPLVIRALADTIVAQHAARGIVLGHQHGHLLLKQLVVQRYYGETILFAVAVRLPPVRILFGLCLDTYWAPVPVRKVRQVMKINFMARRQAGYTLELRLLGLLRVLMVTLEFLVLTVALGRVLLAIPALVKEALEVVVHGVLVVSALSLVPEQIVRCSCRAVMPLLFMTLHCEYGSYGILHGYGFWAGLPKPAASGGTTYMLIR